MHSAASRLDAPGIGCTGRPSAITARATTNPGSLTSGVPASETSATTAPSRKRSMATSAARAEAWSSQRSSLAFRP